MTYKLIKDPMTGQTNSVKLSGLANGHVLIIPFNNDNTDYLEYKAWVDAGNTPEAAD